MYVTIVNTKRGHGFEREQREVYERVYLEGISRKWNDSIVL